MRRFIPLAFLLLVGFHCVASAQVRNATVISLRSNLRDMPSDIGDVKQEISVGSEIKVLDNKGAWFVVRIGDAVGWMHGNTFRFDDSTPQETIPATTNVPPARVQPKVSQPSSNRSGGYMIGPRGGCYYLSGSGRKVYVDRSLCN